MNPGRSISIPVGASTTALDRCRIRPGDLVSYKAGDSLYAGEVHHITVTGTQITCHLLSGQTIAGRSIRAIGIRRADRTTQAAIAIRHEEELLMRPEPSVSQPSSEPPRPPRSPWFHHWKDIADLTMNIYPHEPRVKLITALLDRCDLVYKKGDEAGFSRLKDQLRNLISASTPGPTQARARE
jgi:hypothetical protein